MTTRVHNVLHSSSESDEEDEEEHSWIGAGRGGSPRSPYNGPFNDRNGPFNDRNGGGGGGQGRQGRRGSSVVLSLPHSSGSPKLGSSYSSGAIGGATIGLCSR